MSVSIRLSEIKDILSKTSSKDKASLPLYREALELFVQGGLHQAAAKCKETIEKLEKRFAKELEENRKFENGRGKLTQSSILTWAVKGPQQMKPLPFAGNLAILNNKGSASRPRAVKQESMWPDLPIELLLMVAKYLSLMEKYRVSLSCFRFKSILQSAPSFWTHFDWGEGWSKRFRNANLELLYQMTRGECKTFHLKNSALITPAVFLSIGKSKYQAKRLEELHIQENSKLTGSCLVSFLSNKLLKSSLTKVSLISLRALDDKGVSMLFSMLDNVRDWNLSGCSGLTDACISSLQQKRKLIIKSMIIRHCLFSDKFVHHLVSLSSDTLQIVDFYDCKSVTKQALITLAKCSKLERLEFTGINSKWPLNLDLDDAIMMLAQANPDIRGFQWRNCPFIRDNSLISIAEFCPRLDVLVVEGSANISDAGFRSLAMVSPKLQLLSLKSCPRLTLSVFAQLIKSSGHSWVKLDISGNYWVNDEQLTLIALYCPNLLSLTMNNVPKGKTRRRRLQELILSNNPHLSNESINRLKVVFGAGTVICFQEFTN